MLGILSGSTVKIIYQGTPPFFVDGSTGGTTEYARDAAAIQTISADCYAKLG